jgi:large subunit ribosomal protein L31
VGGWGILIHSFLLSLLSLGVLGVLAVYSSPNPKFPLVIRRFPDSFAVLFMKTDIHPKYVDAEIRCACGNIIKTRSTKQTIIIGICNSCHPFYTGTQKFVDTAGRVDKFQQRAAKTLAAQAEHATKKKKKA